MEDIKIENPVRLVDTLSLVQSKKFGNTPAPGKAELLFISGMQHVTGQRWLQAEEKLKEAKEEAKKSHHTEEGAMSAGCLGFVYLHLEGAGDRAIEQYLESLALWESLHGSSSKKLAAFVEDVALVHRKYGKNDEADRFAARAKSLSS